MCASARSLPCLHSPYRYHYSYAHCSDIVTPVRKIQSLNSSPLLSSLFSAVYVRMNSTRTCTRIFSIALPATFSSRIAYPNNVILVSLSSTPAGCDTRDDARKPGSGDVLGLLAQGGHDAVALLEPVRDWLVERTGLHPELASPRACQVLRPKA